MFKKEEDAEKAIALGNISMDNNTIVISPFKNKNFDKPSHKKARKNNLKINDSNQGTTKNPEEKEK